MSQIKGDLLISVFDQHHKPRTGKKTCQATNLPENMKVVAKKSHAPIISPNSLTEPKLSSKHASANTTLISEEHISDLNTNVQNGNLLFHLKFLANSHFKFAKNLDACLELKEDDFDAITFKLNGSGEDKILLSGGQWSNSQFVLSNGNDRMITNGKTLLSDM